MAPNNKPPSKEPYYLPTPEEIAVACEEIRSKWDRARWEREHAHGYMSADTKHVRFEPRVAGRSQRFLDYQETEL